MEALEHWHTFLVCLLVALEYPVFISSIKWSAMSRLILYVFCLIVTCALLALSIILSKGILFILVCSACVYLIIRCIKKCFSELKNEKANKNNSEPEIEIIPAPKKVEPEQTRTPVIIDAEYFTVIDEE